MSCDVVAARRFIRANARLVDQRLAAVLFDQEDPATVVRALAAYQNPDGGFGHGLEPDKRVPASQPLDVEIAFEYLVAAGAQAPGLVGAACDWLTSIADPSGAVPVLLPSIDGHPRAEHWDRTEYPPGINPTAAIAAHALALGVSHPWIDRATDYCLREFEDGRVPTSAITLLAMTKLIEILPDRSRTRPVAELIASALPSAAWMKLDPGTTDFGVTPLEFAPRPTSTARHWFGDETIEAHLVQLEQEQEADGGWPISWQPPSEASRCEWRAIRTIGALRTLAAYGRIETGPAATG